MVSAGLLSMPLLFVLTAAASAVGPVITLSLKSEAIVRYPAPNLDVRIRKKTGPTLKQTNTSIASPTITPISILAVTTTLTSSSSYYIASKTAVPDCNFQGLPSTLILDYQITSLYALTPLACQTACKNDATFTAAFIPCLSYSYRAPDPSDPSFDNCELFSVPFTDKINGVPLVIKDLVSGIYFGNRWPEDESGFRYS